MSGVRSLEERRSPGPGDDEIRALLARDADAGWRAFVDRYTPTLLALIERAGISDYDEAMEVYLRTCERLSADGCRRLLRHDPRQGPWGAWLPVVVRNVLVDWVRARAGRRRLFRAVEALPRRAQRVFELYYWEGRLPSEICEVLTSEGGEPVSLPDVLDTLGTVERALSERQRRDLLAAAARSRRPLSLETEVEEGRLDPVDPAPGVEAAVTRGESAALLDAALATMDPEDAAIARLRFAHGLTTAEVGRALHLERLAEERVRAIAARLRILLSGDGGVPGGRPARSFAGGTS